jgi:anaerobic magnesium-protoporphyrin IX monomethyl ester cyclase
MPKVALINPGGNNRYAITEPLNLGFIASFLEKAGVEVKIIDELAGQNTEKEIKAWRPDIVGVTATTPFVADAYRVLDMCRGMGILAVMGGVHASLLPEEALKHADIIVKGEGEVAMLDIVRDNIKSGIISRPYINSIDQVPLPARHLMQMDFYLNTRDRLPDAYFFHFIPPHTKTASIFTSRGCPYSCTFCHNTWRDAPWRFNSPERVVLEIEQLVKTYDAKALFFIEDNFFVSKTRVQKICNLIKEKGIDIIWAANSRVNNIDLEILKTAKDAGCREVIFGFESGSQRILNVLNKKTTVEQNRKAVELCNKAGLIPAGSVMIGNPTETIQDVRATQQFLREIDTKSIGVSITTPFPGTELWNLCKERKLIPDSLEWSDFTFDRVVIPVCQTIPAKEIEKLFAETMDIVSEKSSFNLSKFIIQELKHPKGAVARMFHAIKNPSRALKYIKRIKL